MIAPDIPPRMLTLSGLAPTIVTSVTFVYGSSLSPERPTRVRGDGVLEVTVTTRLCGINRTSSARARYRATGEPVDLRRLHATEAEEIARMAKWAEEAM